jgi:hypothetical protein
MNLKVHDSGQDEKSIWTKHTMNFIDRPLRIRNVLKGFKVQYQSDTIVGNKFHIADITENINARGIVFLNILLDIPLPRKERLVIVRFPSGAGIQDWIFEREMFDGIFYIVDNALSHLPS